MKVRIDLEPWNGTYQVTRIDQIIYPGGEYENTVPLEGFPTEALARQFAAQYSAGSTLIAIYENGNEVPH